MLEPDSSSDINDTDSSNSRSSIANDDFLVAIKALCICQLSYHNSQSHEGHRDEEAQWIKALKIDEYKIWNESHIHEQEGHETIVSQAISGYITGLSPSIADRTPFVCFRGTVTLHDLLVDISSLIPSTFYTSNYIEVGQSGAGMTANYSAFRSLGLVQYAVDALLLHGHIVICGHSLGAALATLLAAELLTDHFEFLCQPCHQLSLITFGCPRVFDSHTAKRLHSYHLGHNGINYRNLRFVNSGDLLTTLPVKELPSIADRSSMKLLRSVGSHVLLFHHGKACFFNDQAMWVFIEEANFAPDPDLDPFVFLKSILLFFSSFGDAHRITTSSGYFDHLLHSPQYQEALDSMTNDDDSNLRSSFESLPIVVSPEDPARAAIVSAVSEAVAFLRENPDKSFPIPDWGRAKLIGGAILQAIGAIIISNVTSYTATATSTTTATSASSNVCSDNIASYVAANSILTIQTPAVATSLLTTWNDLRVDWNDLKVFWPDSFPSISIEDLQSVQLPCSGGNLNDTADTVDINTSTGTTSNTGLGDGEDDTDTCSSSVRQRFVNSVMENQDIFFFGLLIGVAVGVAICCFVGKYLFFVI